METIHTDLKESLEEEDQDLILNPVEEQDEIHSLELCLIGHFLTDQSINYNVIKNRIASIWKPVKGLWSRRMEMANICSSSTICWTFIESLMEAHGVLGIFHSYCITSREENIRYEFL
ncbi:hypothetical protein ACS0TY_032860 [Phlomoides rotata]